VAKALIYFVLCFVCGRLLFYVSKKFCNSSDVKVTHFLSFFFFCFVGQHVYFIFVFTGGGVIAFVLLVVV
jgi:hypothetical protein